MKYALFGNCQAEAMRWLLSTCPAFTQKYEHVVVPASYTMSEESARAFCETTLPNLDLLFMHPHSANRSHWHDHNTIAAAAAKHGVRLIRFPQIYWDAYNPFERQNAVVGTEHGDEFTYTDMLLLESAALGLSYGQFTDRLRAGIGQLEAAAVSSLERALASMKSVEVERACDFPISDFLAENHASSRLMHNNNHPMGPTMGVVCNRLLKTVNPEYSTPHEPDVFPNHDTIIYPFVRKAQNLAEETLPDKIEARYARYIDFVQAAPARQAEFLDLSRGHLAALGVHL